MDKLQKLTTEQEKLMFSTRDSWINDFYNKKEIDKKEFEKGINWLYTDMLKKKKPKIVYVDSWLGCVLSIHVLKKLGKNTVENTVWNTVENTVENTVRNTVWNTVENTVENTVRNTVWNTVENTVRNTVWNTVENTVENTVRNTFSDYSDYTNSYSNYGWVSFYDYFEKVGILQNSDFSKYKKLIKSGAFQVYEYENIVFAVEPPKIIRNTQGQVHDLEKAAVEFKDGDKQYYINGLNLPEETFIKVRDGGYNIEDFSKESNEEVKSACIAFMQEKFGEEYIIEFFKDSLKELDTYIDKKNKIYLKGTTGSMDIGVYTLFKGVINETEVAYVRCYCPSTDRMFFLGVDPSNNTAKDAIASLYRVPKVLKDDIKYIARQGERYTTVFTEEVHNRLKNSKYSSEELEDLVSLSGEEYFSKITYEY